MRQRSSEKIQKLVQAAVLVNASPQSSFEIIDRSGEAIVGLLQRGFCGC